MEELNPRLSNYIEQHGISDANEITLTNGAKYQLEPNTSDDNYTVTFANGIIHLYQIDLTASHTNKKTRGKNIVLSNLGLALLI